MKNPELRLVEKTNARMRCNRRIDEAIQTGKKHGGTKFEIALLDTVMRPYVLALVDERFRLNPDPNDARETVSNFAANIVSEFIVNIAERDDPAEAIKQSRIMIGQLMDALATCLQVNYGLTEQQARDTVDAAPPTH